MGRLIASLGLTGLALAWLATARAEIPDPKTLPSSTSPASSYIPSLGRQLLVCVSDDWASIHATLYGFSRRDEHSTWQLDFTFPAVLGRTGMGWGLGLHGWVLGEGPIKREGDLRSPAGLFRLPTLFGYGPRKDSGTTDYPYLPLSKTTFAVDDPASPFYNRMVDTRSEDPRQWKSAETMLRPDGAYRLGIWVAHNDPSVEFLPTSFSKGLPAPGTQALGSCIFIHIWRSPDKSTIGCTAISPQNMENLVRWLRFADGPLLVQLPLAEYLCFQSRWNLPNLRERSVTHP